MKTVMVFGTFDIVHSGHIHMFKEAREYGDRLVVVVARDSNVERIKGYKTFHNEKERADFLKELKLTDTVILGGKTDYYKMIKKIKPAVICLGYDQKVFVDKLANKITEFGLEIEIARLCPYQENRFKSKKLKKYIERVV